MDKQSRNVLQDALDPMCVPQIGLDPFREPGESFAQDLRAYIEFVLGCSDTFIDPLDTNSIY